MPRFGNRPDCAYFLLLGLCGAAFLLTIGGILTYIAFNPEGIDTVPHSALSHIPESHHNFHHNHNHHHSTDKGNNNNNPTLLSLQPHESSRGGSNASSESEFEAKQNLALAIVGPLCLLMGIIVTLTVGAFALKYDCDHEPEPNIAFLRLKSEMSLSFDPEKNNYELLIPALPSSSTAAATNTMSTGLGYATSKHPRPTTTY